MLELSSHSEAEALLLSTSRFAKPGGLIHPLPVPSGTGIGFPFTRFSRAIGGEAADRSWEGSEKCNHPMVDTTGKRCGDPSGLKTADVRLVYNNEAHPTGKTLKTYALGRVSMG